MRTDITFGSGEDTPKIEITVNEGRMATTWITLSIGGIGGVDLDFFNNPAKVLSDLKHAVRMAEVALYGDEPDALTVAS